MGRSGLERHWKGIMVYCGERSSSVTLSPPTSGFGGFEIVAGGLMSEWRWGRQRFVGKKKKICVRRDNGQTGENKREKISRRP